MAGLYRIVIEVTVHDDKDLEQAARTVAHDCGMHALSAKEWEALRIEESDPVIADLQMIFDPGISPDGTSIEGVTVEYLGD